MSAPKFEAGALVATPAALAAFAAVGANPASFIARHLSGEWGDLDDDDKRMNDLAVAHNERVLSAYTLTDGTRIYVITEADRSSTCILLPEEY